MHTQLNSCNDQSSKQSYAALAVLALGYFVLRSFFFDYFLLWDNRAYYDNIINAQALPFDILYYSTSNHNSQAWNLLAGISNYFFHHNYYVYNAWIALLCTIGVVTFYFVVEELTAHSLGLCARLLVTAIFAFHPSLLSNEIQASADTGLMLFWVWFLLALLKEKIVIATVTGILLVFSKEPALIHLCIVFIFCALRQPHDFRLLWMKRFSKVVWIPLAFYGAFLGYKLYRGHYLFFKGFLQEHTDWSLKILPDYSLITFTMMALVLNFNWVLTLLAVAFTALRKRIGDTGDYAICRRQAGAMLWLLLATLVMVLAVRHYSNVRYLLPIFPVMILYVAHLLPVITRPNARIGVLVALLALFGWQDFRSVDPVSNMVFCTTPFGSHRVLSIPSFGKICTVGEMVPRLLADRLVYNLEFTHVANLLGTAIRDINPDSTTSFMLEDDYNFLLLFWLDEEGHFTTTDSKKVPRIYATSALRKWNQLDSPPDTLYYFRLPTEPNNPNVADFLARYSTFTEKTYNDDGYELTVVTYEHKNSGEWCDAR